GSPTHSHTGCEPEVQCQRGDPPPARTNAEQNLVYISPAGGVLSEGAPPVDAPAELWDAFFVRLFGACHDIAKELADSGFITGTLWDESGSALLRAWWLATFQPQLKQSHPFIIR